jgi:DNA-binding CsgD family transcriptional regulator
MPDSKDPDLSQHWLLTESEQRVLHLLGQGRSDEQIAVETKSGLRAVQSVLRRFRDRTGIAGRSLVAWAIAHEQCCISVST